MSGSRMPVGGRGRTQVSGRTKLLGLAAIIVIILGLAVWQGWSRFHRPVPQSAATKGPSFSMGKPLEATPVSVGSNVNPAQERRPDLADTRKPAPPPWTAPKVQPMGFWQDTTNDTARPPQSPIAPAVEAKADPDVLTPGGGQSEYSARMQTTSVSNITPALHRFHNPYTIEKGWQIPCIPTMPISSELPGPVHCITTEEVRSMDGSTVLLPRYTKINGQIEHGLSNGDRRLFLIWTDALTPKPDLLPIPLEGMPAADEAGQIGVPGDLNAHTWEKLKATALVTLLQTASSAAVATAQSGSGNNYFSPIGTAGNGLAEQAFGADRSIPTTLYRGPGQPLTVYVSKYVDLYKFYRNVPVRH